METFEENGEYPENISEEEMINTLLKVIESQSRIIRKMIRYKIQEKSS